MIIIIIRKRIRATVRILLSSMKKSDDHQNFFQSFFPSSTLNFRAKILFFRKINKIAVWIFAPKIDNQEIILGVTLFSFFAIFEF